MKKLVVSTVLILFLADISYATDSAIQRKIQPRRSAIQSTNMVFSSGADSQVYNRFDKAIKEIQEKISQNPNDYSLNVSLVNLYLKTKQYSEAYDELIFLSNLATANKLNENVLNKIEETKNNLTNSIRYERNWFGMYTNLALLNLILQDAKSAEQCIISSANSLTNIGMFVDVFKRVYDFTGNYNNAITTLDKVISANPSEISLKRLKSNYLMQLDRKDEAIQEMSKILVEQPNDSELRYSLFNLLIEKNLGEKELFKKLYPVKVINYEKSYTELANILYEDNRISEAKIYAQKLVDKFPENADGYILLSEIFRKEGDLQSAYEALKIVRSKADSNEAIAKYNVMLARFSDQPVKEADSLMNNGLYSQALSVLETANQENMYVILGMARANYFLGEKQKAFDLLNKAMSLYPNNPDVFYYFAFIFYKEGDIQSSRNYVEQALKVNPEHSYTHQLVDILNKAESDKYINQIISSFEAQNYDEAMRLINEGLQINKKDSVLYYYQGLTYIAMNNYAAATAPLYKSIELDKNNILAYFYLALSFDNLSEKENALSYYQKFIQLLPEDDYGESEKMNYANSRIEKLSN